MTYTKEYLEKLLFADVREVARGIGVQSPTLFKKSDLIDKILAVQSGLAVPYYSKRGRKRKSRAIECEKPCLVEPPSDSKSKKIVLDNKKIEILREMTKRYVDAFFDVLSEKKDENE